MNLREYLNKMYRVPENKLDALLTKHSKIVENGAYFRSGSYYVAGQIYKAEEESWSEWEDTNLPEYDIYYCSVCDIEHMLSVQKEVKCPICQEIISE